jgi:hypothetical protein
MSKKAFICRLLLLSWSSSTAAGGDTEGSGGMASSGNGVASAVAVVSEKSPPSLKCWFHFCSRYCFPMSPHLWPTRQDLSPQCHHSLRPLCVRTRPAFRVVSSGVVEAKLCCLLAIQISKETGSAANRVCSAAGDRTKTG